MKSSLGPKRSEAQILSSCLEYLRASGIWAMRMNVGGMKLDKRYVRFGVKGCADILAIEDVLEGFMPVWIECKREGGKQSDAQYDFQRAVEEYGMRYVVVHSAAELSDLL